MRWHIAEAKQRLSELIRAATESPQLIYRRDQLVAVIIGPDEARAFEKWREAHRGESVGAAFEELRRLAREEQHELSLPPREDRPNPFANLGYGVKGLGEDPPTY